jgi:multidrug efflux pump subunit AcrA (membrane-fusion protein)
LYAVGKGVAGCALITTFSDATEVHVVKELATVKVYVPATSPDIVALVPVPVVIVPPGLLVNVQVPDAGKPLNTTLPVASAQVG